MHWILSSATLYAGVLWFHMLQFLLKVDSLGQWAVCVEAMASNV